MGAHVFQCATCHEWFDGAAEHPVGAPRDQYGRIGRDYDGPRFCSVACRDLAICEEHHIPLTLHIGKVEEADEDAGEVAETLACRLCVAIDAIYDRDHRIVALSHDNHRL